MVLRPACCENGSALGVNTNNRAARKDLDRQSRTIRQLGSIPQLLITLSSMDKMPGVRPLHVRLGQVHILDRLAVLVALDVSGHKARPEILSVDAHLA